MINVGILGAGYWGPKFARNFAQHRGARLRGVADLRLERAQATAMEWGAEYATEDPERVLRDPEVDLVVVATPAWTHYELTRTALEENKHALVMKPLTTNAAEAEELCRIADARGLALAVDHTFIFTGAVQKMKALVDAGELGDLYYFDSVRINLGLFQSDVNVLWDLAPHDVSIMDYLMGCAPDDVAAVAMSHGGSPTENIAYLTARYDEAVLAHVHVNWLAPAKIRRTIVGGSRKMLVYDDMEPSEKVRIYDKGVEFSSEPSHNGADEYELLVSYRSGDVTVPQISTREALAAEVENVIDAIHGRAPLMVDGQAGVRVVRILETAAKSIPQGGLPVALTGVPV
ncbi:MAG: Gfo/Idh/MocA family protein [Gemmatimonadota bacterium]